VSIDSKRDVLMIYPLTENPNFFSSTSTSISPQPTSQLLIDLGSVAVFKTINIKNHGQIKAQI
jgi:hypothetical protein